MTDHDDRSEHPTDRAHAPPSGTGHDLILPENAAVPEPQPDPNSYSHFALGQLLDRVRGLEADKGALGIKKLLDEQSDRILKETSADYGSLRSSITGLQQSVDALVTRIGNTETALDAGTKRFQAIEEELAAMRSQMTRLEQLRPHLERLEGALAKLKLEGAPDVAGSTEKKTE